MALDQIANFVRGSTDAATDSTQTTISVVDASVFPDPANGDYNLVLWYDNSYPRPDQDPDVEIVRVTGRDTTNNDLTVTRGQETTTGAAHPSGSALQLSPTAKVFGDIAPADQAVEDFTTNGGVNTVPQSDGAGGLTMNEVGGGGILVEDTGPAGDPNGGDPDTWTTVASLGTARQQLAAASDANGLLYAIGGNSSANTYESLVEQYDPATDTWTTVASLGTGRRYLAAALDANGLLYAIGGDSSASDYESVVEQYDPATDTWTTVASLGTGRLKLAAATDANGLVYAIGGQSSANTYESLVEQYDPATDTWTTVASLGTGRRSLAAASDANGLPYAIGGDSSANSFESVVEQYDPATDTWTTVASLGTGRVNLAAASDANGLVYATGGRSSATSYSSVVEQYDPATDTWTTVASLGTGRQYLAAATDNNGLVYAIGGVQAPSFTTSAVVEQLQFNLSYADAYSATGDTLFTTDDANALIKNRTTGRVANPNVARDGETIAWYSETTARLVRTEEP